MSTPRTSLAKRLSNDNRWLVRVIRDGKRPVNKLTLFAATPRKALRVALKQLGPLPSGTAVLVEPFIPEPKPQSEAP